MIWSHRSHISAQKSHMKGALKHGLLGSTSRRFDSVGLGWELRICTYQKLPGAAASGGPEISLGDPAVWSKPRCIHINPLGGSGLGRRMPDGILLARIKLF